MSNKHNHANQLLHQTMQGACMALLHEASAFCAEASRSSWRSCSISATVPTIVRSATRIFIMCMQ